MDRHLCKNKELPWTEARKIYSAVDKAFLRCHALCNLPRLRSIAINIMDQTVVKFPPGQPLSTDKATQDLCLLAIVRRTIPAAVWLRGDQPRTR